MNTPAAPIDTGRFAERLRARSIDVAGRRILISRIAGSRQEVDLTAAPTCNGYGRVRHFKLETKFGWPSNPLPIVPACHRLGIPAPPAMTALVYQNAACAWRCWYCFVPEELLVADPSQSAWLSADELVSMYRAVPERPLIIDLSGGSPDLVPEWTVWMMRALEDAGIDRSTYLWGDDNLSTNYLFDRLDKSDLHYLQQFRNYGRVCCLKGYDARSFAFNTRAAEKDFDAQFAILGQLLKLEIDVYGYITLTSPYSDHIQSGICDLIDRLQVIDPNFPLRVVPLRIQIFAPVRDRIAKRAEVERERSLAIQEEAVAAWNAEIANRFDGQMRALPICSVPLRRNGAM